MFFKSLSNALIFASLAALSKYIFLTSPLLHSNAPSFVCITTCSIALSSLFSFFLNRLLATDVMSAAVFSLSASICTDLSPNCSTTSANSSFFLIEAISICNVPSGLAPNALSICSIAPCPSCVLTAATNAFTIHLAFSQPCLPFILPSLRNLFNCLAAHSSFLSARQFSALSIILLTLSTTLLSVFVFAFSCALTNANSMFFAATSPAVLLSSFLHLSIAVSINFFAQYTTLSNNFSGFLSAYTTTSFSFSFILSFAIAYARNSSRLSFTYFHLASATFLSVIGSILTSGIKSSTVSTFIASLCSFTNLVLICDVLSLSTVIANALAACTNSCTYTSVADCSLPNVGLFLFISMQIPFLAPSNSISPSVILALSSTYTASSGIALIVDPTMYFTISTCLLYSASSLVIPSVSRSLSSTSNALFSELIRASFSNSLYVPFLSPLGVLAYFITSLTLPLSVLILFKSLLQYVFPFTFTVACTFPFFTLPPSTLTVLLPYFNPKLFSSLTCAAVNGTFVSQY